jgi:hypothetical protein
VGEMRNAHVILVGMPEENETTLTTLEDIDGRITLQWIVER